MTSLLLLGVVAGISAYSLQAKGADDSSGSSPSPSNKDKINDPQNPKKEDTKDISDIPQENGSHCLTNGCPTPTSHSGSKHHHRSTTADPKHGGGLTQIPSNKTDYPDNDASVIQVHVSSAKKDIIGAWHITGEITNVGNDTIQFVHITAHLYDATSQLVGNAEGYTSPTDLDTQHTGTFDALITKDMLSGKPTTYRLSYDWS